MAKATRRDNPSLLFRDLRADPAPPVQTLVKGPKALVAEIDESLGCITLEEESLWVDDAPFLASSKPLTVHHAKPDALFGDVSGLRPGCEVRQYRCVADLPEMFAAFSNEWTTR